MAGAVSKKVKTSGQYKPSSDWKVNLFVAV